MDNQRSNVLIGACAVDACGAEVEAEDVLSIEPSTRGGPRSVVCVHESRGELRTRRPLTVLAKTKGGERREGQCFTQCPRFAFANFGILACTFLGVKIDTGDRSVLYV
jgi:hypothetical protein